MADAVGNAAVEAARQARREARRAERVNVVKAEIQDIAPARRRDRNADAAFEETRRPRDEADARIAAAERRRQLRQIDTQPEPAVRSGSRAPTPDDDPDLADAAPRTPLRASDLSSSRVAPLSQSFAGTTFAGHSGLGGAGGGAGAATALQPMAATYFRGDMLAAVQPLVPPALPRALGVFAGGTPNNVAAASAAAAQPAAAAAAATLGGRIRLPALGGGSSSPEARVSVYEESIATGHFKRVDTGGAFGGRTDAADGAGGAGGGGGGGGAGGASGAAAAVAGKRLFLSRALRSTGMASGGGAGSDEPTEPLSTEIEWLIRRGCSTAQGLLAGVLLVIILQLGTAAGSDNAGVVQLMAPALSWFRFTAYVLGMVSWLGAAHAVLQARGTLGRYLPPYRTPTPAAALLATTARWTYVAAVSYTVFMLATFGSMPLDNALRTAAIRQWSAATIARDAALLTKAQAWRALAAIRFAAAVVGWVATSFSLATPQDQAAALDDVSRSEREESGATAAAVAAAAAAAAAASASGKAVAVPATTTGFGVNTNTALPPALV